MMNTKRHNIKHSAFLKEGISILMYHQVGDFSPMKTHRASYCHYRRFSAQMKLLSLLGYHVMDFETAIKAIEEKTEIPPLSVVLTFDDGCRNFYEYAYPVLKKFRFPAIVYVVSGLIGKKAEWFSREDRHAPALMSEDILLELRKNGIIFGAHGMSHVRLAETETARQREEIFKSKAVLEDILGEEVRHFCYPYGSYDKAVLNLTKEAGYKTAVTCSRGTAYPGDDLLQLPRKAISYGDSLAGFLWKIHIKNKRKTPPL